MRWIYVAHPLRGDHPDDLKAIGENYDKVARICRQIAKEHDDVLILSPLNAFSFFSPFEDQTQVMEMCLELLGLADELWVYGDWRKSEGCCKEVAYAGLYGIQTRFAEEKPCSD